jgi:hypothetical protein
MSSTCMGEKSLPLINELGNWVHMQKNQINLHLTQHTKINSK